MHRKSWSNKKIIQLKTNRPTYSKVAIIGKSGTGCIVGSIRIRLLPNKVYRSDAALLERDFPVGTDLRVYDYHVGNTVEVPLRTGWDKQSIDMFGKRK